MSGSGLSSQRRSSGAFSVFRCLFFLLTLVASALHAECNPPSPSAKLSTVATVIDGDTIELVSGERIRITGLNAPEISDSHGQTQPFAELSHNYLEALIRENNQRVLLESDNQPLDSHGRTLAHLFSVDGTSITEKMLLAGLAARATVPPNTNHANCYHLAENKARDNKAGLWRSPEFWLIDHRTLKPEARGFYIIRDVVTAVEESRKSIWINLAHGVALRIAKKDLAEFAELNFKNLQGSNVEARGWVSTHKDRVRLRIRNTINLQTINQ